VYNKTPKEHLQHLETVLRLLREIISKQGDQVRLLRSRTPFPGVHTVSRDGLKVDGHKSPGGERLAHTTLDNVGSFLDWSSYFRRCIQEYSSLVTPLTNLTCDKSPFVWSAECKSIRGREVCFDTCSRVILPHSSANQLRSGMMRP
jgi:hypothetical protein